MTYFSVFLPKTQQLHLLSFGAPTEWYGWVGGTGEKLRAYAWARVCILEDAVSHQRCYA